jgi:DNA-binding NarL/FixJ family response regulator
MQLIRILLVDDSPDFIESAARFLSADPRLEIVGRASSGKEALVAVKEAKPDLVLMDWAMPEMPGPVAMRRIKSEPPAPRVIVLTMYDLPEYRAIAKLAYADGFVAKSDFGEKLVPLIYQLFQDAETVEK